MRNYVYIIKVVKFVGMSENDPSKTTKTVKAFLIASAFGGMKELVSLNPVCTQTSDEHYNLTPKVIKMLQDCDFNIL